MPAILFFSHTKRKLYFSRKESCCLLENVSERCSSLKIFNTDFITSWKQNISYIAEKTSGYINSATKKLAANLKSGMVFPEAAPVDDQANGMTKVGIGSACSLLTSTGILISALMAEISQSRPCIDPQFFFAPIHKILVHPTGPNCCGKICWEA